MPLRVRAARQAGFSMIEVLITLIVIAIGLLGVAGMQALAINNTTIARVQSLAALQAASLAAAMQANEQYWALNPASTSVNDQTLGDATLNGQSVNCSMTACDKTQMAAYDLKQWGQSLKNLLPGGQGNVSCTPNVGTPVTCTISISWLEKNVALNQATGTETGDLATGKGDVAQTFTMVAEP